MWMNSDVRCAGDRSMPTTGKSGSASPNRFSIARNRTVFPAHGSATKAPGASVMMQIPGVGPFIRALLVVRLAGGTR